MDIDYISGFEGSEEVKDFIETFKKVWKEQGTKERGAKKRFQILIGRLTDIAIFVPTVTTAGLEIIIAWNLTEDDKEKIEKRAKEKGIPISYRPYLWIGKPPIPLPHEGVVEKEEQEKASENKTSSGGNGCSQA